MTDKEFMELKKVVENLEATDEQIKQYTKENERRDKDKSAVNKARKEALEIANDFYYPQSVKDDLNSATGVLEINRIMKNAKKYI